MIKKTTEVKVKENEDISPFINNFLKDYVEDRDVYETASLTPITRLTEDGRRYALWLGRNTAIFAIRKDKNKVMIGLIKAKNMAELTEELRKVGIEIQGFTGTTETYWNDLKACLFAAMNIEDTDVKEEAEGSEEKEESEKPESKEKSEQPELPFESADFESMSDYVSDYIKTAEELEDKTKKQKKSGTSGITF
jgi:hypothetical protein